MVHDKFIFISPHRPAELVSASFSKKGGRIIKLYFLSNLSR
jgi:hypothetical protein